MADRLSAPAGSSWLPARQKAWAQVAAKRAVPRQRGYGRVAPWMMKIGKPTLKLGSS